ncbi:MAG: SAM-dependent methyltransferase [Planctomycetia bacterium]|nr:SAM-dependent methyltransferase [Planctomycetia bacterium]
MHHPVADDPLQTVEHSLSTGDCLLLVLSRKRDGVDDTCSKISVRPVEVQRQRMFQFTRHLTDRTIHENLEPVQAAQCAVELLETTFRDAALYTPQADFSIRANSEGGYRCTRKPPSRGASPGAPGVHNRPKSHLIPEGVPCPFLVEIGVMTADGRVRSTMTRKFRQINRFLELVNDVVPSLETGRELRVVDFGCGKSYLTFALHHLLTDIHGRPVRIVGLDRKADVMAECAGIAARLGCRGLEFRQGDIATHHESEPVDLAVSLHACDTATDDALAQAVRWQSRVILAVPCCQHELAGQIDCAELAPLLRHGILHEQFAALATDGLRSLALEACGYATQIVEFIDLEHTAKNLLIRAVRRDRADPELHAARLAEYCALQRLLGIKSSYLDAALGLK